MQATPKWVKAEPKEYGLWRARTMDIAQSEAHLGSASTNTTSDAYIEDLGQTWPAGDSLHLAVEGRSYTLMKQLANSARPNKGPGSRPPKATSESFGTGTHSSTYQSLRSSKAKSLQTGEYSTLKATFVQHCFAPYTDMLTQSSLGREAEKRSPEILPTFSAPSIDQNRRTPLLHPSTPTQIRTQLQAPPPSTPHHLQPTPFPAELSFEVSSQPIVREPHSVVLRLVTFHLGVGLVRKPEESLTQSIYCGSRLYYVPLSMIFVVFSSLQLHPFLPVHIIFAIQHPCSSLWRTVARSAMPNCHQHVTKS